MPFIDLDQIEKKEIIPGFRAQFIHSENMTLAFWEIDEGVAMPEHSHPHEQMTRVLEGRFELMLAGEARELDSGSVAVIPPNTKHGGSALTNCRIFDVFYPVREDYR